MRLDRNTRLAIALSSITFLIHSYAVFFAGFSWFRDELYYMASTDHLAFGYVDHPPLSIWLLWLVKTVFGESLVVVRLVPAIVSSVVVFLASKTAQRLGGGTISVVLTALSVTFMPVFMGMNSVYSMNTFEYFFWTLSIYMAISLQDDPSPRKFIWLGVVMGIALLNKISAGWLIAGFFVSLILSHNRTWFTTRWPWLTGGIALIIFSPFIIWNIANDLPHLEFMRNAVELKYGNITRLDFLTGQIMMISPLPLLVAISGLWYLFFNNEGRKQQTPGIVFVTTGLILLANSHSKPEYLGAAYPALLAAGGVFLEKQVILSKWAAYPVKYLLPSAIVLTGLFAMPIVVPVLNVDDTIKYLQDSGFSPPSNEGHRLTHLPQHYADMHGWEELARSVKEVYESIPGKDTLSILIVANNYGEASAINVLGKKYGLPYCTTEHNSYWMWGTPKEKYDCYISIGDSEEDVRGYAVDPVLKGVHTARYAMPYENNLNIWVAYRLKYPLPELWAKVKKYI